MASKTPDEIRKIYATMSAQDELLYHVAHARKENSDTPYDGAALKARAKGRASLDIKKLREVEAEYRQRSLSRPDSGQSGQ
jgi:hypothetical protein